MNYREQPLVFPAEGEQLLGILSSPAQGVAASGVGMVIIVGGPQYRAGSHRQFVLLARALASQGHHCLRFDYRGMGDSDGAPRNFEQIDADISAALSALRSERPGLGKLLLWGLCDGASASLMYLHSQAAAANVCGVCLLNPWVRSVETLARARVKHYYRERLMQRSFWLKLIRGGVAAKALRSLILNLRQANATSAQANNQEQIIFTAAMARGLKAFNGPVLLVLSGRDLTAKEFVETAATNSDWSGAMTGQNITRADLPLADHTFSESTHRRQLELIVLDWVRSINTTAEARNSSS